MMSGNIRSGILTQTSGANGDQTPTFMIRLRNLVLERKTGQSMLSVLKCLQPKQTVARMQAGEA